MRWRDDEVLFQLQGRCFVARRWAPGAETSRRPLRRAEAEVVLRRLMQQGDAHKLRALYARLTDCGGLASMANEEVLRWLLTHGADEYGRPGRFVLLELGQGAAPDAGPTAPATGRASVEEERVRRSLQTLGDRELVHAGQRYRLLQLGAPSRLCRDDFETLAEREAREVLKGLSEDPTRGDREEREALDELWTQCDADARVGRMRILVLRRRRALAAQTEAGPAITPSALRAARAVHWLVVETVDTAQRPVPCVRLELAFADGSVVQTSTGREGALRLEPVPAGSVSIRVLDRDAQAWRPAAGAPATRVSARGPGRRHVVRQGEGLTKIAARHGLSDWRAIWDDPKNSALRAKRSSPQVLLPGDVVSLPGAQLAQIERATDAVHRLELPQPPLRVRVRLQDLAGRPLDGRRYDVRYREGEAWVERPGAAPSDAQGWLEEHIPSTVASLVVLLQRPKLRFEFPINALNPARDVDSERPIASGIAARLAGLGYAPRASARPDAAVRDESLALFQALGLERADPSGIPDASTLQALERAYTV